MSVSTEFSARVSEALKAGVIHADGHTLFYPRFYAPYFSEAELEEAGLVQTHKSDGSHKGSIWAEDGSLVQELKAVYNLDFLGWVAREVGVTDYPQSMGRGFMAQEWVDFIRKALA